MTSEVHIILQGKGGVGKSVVARLLIEHFIHTGITHAGYDADAVNQSFAAVDGYNAEIVDLVEGGEINTRKFDTLVNNILSHKNTSIVVDCGASSFLPIIGYMEQADTIETLTDEGMDVFIHTVVTGGPSTADTLSGYKQISERFADDAYIVVWQNPYFGDVQQDGVKFVDIPAVKDAVEAGKLLGVIQIPAMHRMTEEDFSEFLGKNVSFAKATEKNSKLLDTLVKKRISKVHANLMEQIAIVLVEEDTAGSTDAG